LQGIFAGGQPTGLPSISNLIYFIAFYYSIFPCGKNDLFYTKEKGLEALFNVFALSKNIAVWQ
jgi:hypothetical protein